MLCYAKSLQLCPTLYDRPWDSPCRNTGVGCYFLLQRMKMKSKVKSLSRVQLLATPWTAAYQAPPSMGFSRQEYWSGVPLPSPQFLLWTHIDDTGVRLPPRSGLQPTFLSVPVRRINIDQGNFKYPDIGGKREFKRLLCLQLYLSHILQPTTQNISLFKKQKQAIKYIYE